jgi:hypothetical protein
LDLRKTRATAKVDGLRETEGRHASGLSYTPEKGKDNGGWIRIFRLSAAVPPLLMTLLMVDRERERRKP